MYVDINIATHAFDGRLDQTQANAHARDAHDIGVPVIPGEQLAWVGQIFSGHTVADRQHHGDGRQYGAAESRLTQPQRSQDGRLPACLP